MASIYLCDDDSALIQFLKDVLEASGHTVAAAKDMQSFRFLLSGRLPDLAILDIEFPGGGGPAAAALLPPQVPVLVLSGLSTIDQMGRFKGRPEIRFLEKPIDLGLLECALQALLTPRSARSADAQQRGH